MRDKKRLPVWSFLTVLCLLWTLPAWGQVAVDQKIDQLNAALQAEGLTWTAGRTKMSGLSPEQRRSFLGGPMAPLRDRMPTFDALQERDETPAAYTGGAPRRAGTGATWAASAG